MENPLGSRCKNAESMRFTGICRLWASVSAGNHERMEKHNVELMGTIIGINGCRESCIHSLQTTDESGDITHKYSDKFQT